MRQCCNHIALGLVYLMQWHGKFPTACENAINIFYKFYLVFDKIVSSICDFNIPKRENNSRLDSI